MARPRTTLCLAAIVVLTAFAVLAQPPAGGGGQGRGAGGGQGRGGGVTPPRASGPATEAPRGTATLKGVVLAADTGAPVRRAQVRVTSPNTRESRLATTDSQGRFEVRELPAGRYNINANKGGFVPLQYGQRRPGEPGTPIELGDAQVVDKLVIALPRGSVIAGRITDEFGEPISNAAVTAMRYGYNAGVRRLMNAGGSSRDTTDDLGQFRLFGLLPGEYVVSAMFRGAGGEVTEPAAEPSGFAPTYFPGTPNPAEAQRVRLDVGQENTNVTFALTATRLVRVGGTIISSQGQLVTNGQVMLTSVASLIGAEMPGLNARIDANGRFRITGVAPGQYVLVARAMPGPPGRGGRGPQAAENAEIGRLEISVGLTDVDDVVMATAPGGRVAGQIVTDSGAPLTIKPQQVQIAARNASPFALPMIAGVAGGRPNEDWSFELGPIFDAPLFRVSVPEGWSLKQILIGGQDFTDTPVQIPPGQIVRGMQIVLTDKITDLSGRVVDTRGNPVADATVIVFPSDDRYWTFQSRFIRSARPTPEGTFSIRGLPAHDAYLIVAVQGLESGQAADPEYLATIREAATRVSLNEGETKSVDVRLR